MKKIIFIFLSLLFGALIIIFNYNNHPKNLVQMEKLNRGLTVAAYDDGVFLSWRIYGYENPQNIQFDIYRDNKKIYRTKKGEATNYFDLNGNTNNKYQVVLKNKKPDNKNYQKALNTVINSSNNRALYMDLKLDIPKSKKTIYLPNDTSVGDLDGDGDYEIIVKMEPSDKKDNSERGKTSPTYFDAYDVDWTSGETTFLWRIDGGKNIRSGPHYTPFLVYDFDFDGKSEIVLRTAPGTIDGLGNYVSDAGNEEIKRTDNKKSYVNKNGHILDGSEFLTIFSGMTGKAIDTIYFPIPRDITSNWGDDYGNRSNRFLATVAYLDGIKPSIIFSRGYYEDAYISSINYQDNHLTVDWLSKNLYNKSILTKGDIRKESNLTCYKEGNHSLIAGDVDNDNKDEIIFGSAIIDDTGSVLSSTKNGHGDALMVSDFNNDGILEIFQIHETKYNSLDIRIYDDKEERHFKNLVLLTSYFDVARGIIGNFDDNYSSESIFYSHIDDNIYDIKGQKIKNNYRPEDDKFINFSVYWDSDLGKELLDDNQILKYQVDKDNILFLWDDNDFMPNSNSINGSKKNPALVADVLGDFREEIFMVNEEGIRVWISNIKTPYLIPTLMHDKLYRVSIASQNVGYNMPPYTSYYIGSASLLQKHNKKLNYLNPKYPFTKIKVQ